MSTLFRYVETSPRSDWQFWISDTAATSSEICNVVKSICLINKKSGLPMFPKDIWNVIVHFMYPLLFRTDPNRWNGNVFNWIEEWISNPVQREHNPLYFTASEGGYPILDFFRLSKTERIEQVFYSVLSGEGVGEIGQLSFSGEFGRPNVQPDFIEYKIVRNGDMCLGLQIDDVSNIKSCNLFIGGHLIRTPYEFIEKYQATARLLPEQEQKSSSKQASNIKFYFNKDIKVIPTLVLQYHEVSVRIVLIDETLPPPRINQIQSYIGLDLRAKMVHQSHHELGDGPEKFLISNGRAQGYIPSKKILQNS